MNTKQKRTRTMTDLFFDRKPNEFVLNALILLVCFLIAFFLLGSFYNYFIYGDIEGKPMTMQVKIQFEETADGKLNATSASARFVDEIPKYRTERYAEENK